MFETAVLDQSGGYWTQRDAVIVRSRLCRAHFLPTIKIAQGKPGTDNEMLLRSGLALDVCGCQNRAVGQSFHAGVATVFSGVTVQQLDPVFAGTILPNIFIGANQRHNLPRMRLKS